MDKNNKDNNKNTRNNNICPCCGGAGRTEWSTCDLCRGSGEVPDIEVDEWELLTTPEISKIDLAKIVSAIARDFFDPDEDTLEF